LFIPGYNVLKLGIDYVVPEIIGNLGKGGTASIYGGTLINPLLIGKHGLTNIAVKLFPEKAGDHENSSASESSANDSFLYEVAIMNLIQPNPHIVKFIGFMETPRCAIIMKQYEGSLYGLLKEKIIAIDPNLCFKVARDVANGMKLIHGMNILHLDVKPHNILWERLEDGSLNFCICDFGFASLVGESRAIVSGLQVPKSVGITVRYTAPEVFVRLALSSNNSGRVNTDLCRKIDVYAFGLSIYEVMNGGSFWKDLDYAGIIKKVQIG
jgi:serine/threonine protein kinase